MPPEDVVIILDAHDVLFFPCQRDIVEEFHALSVDILFGADYNAFPDNGTAAYFPDTPRLQSRGPPQKCVLLLIVPIDRTHVVLSAFYVGLHSLQCAALATWNSRPALPLRLSDWHDIGNDLLCRFLNCGGIMGYAEDVLYYIARYFYGSGRSHEAFKDQRFWTDMFLYQVCPLKTSNPNSVALFVCSAGSVLAATDAFPRPS